MSGEITLPAVVRKLAQAQRALRTHYGHPQLKFTLDGNLVGDVGEALAIEAFRVVLSRRIKGVDGHAPNGKSVQVKATGKANRGPSFSKGEGKADYLLFFRIDFEKGTAAVAYNGPEAPIRALLPKLLDTTHTVPLELVLAADTRIRATQRLKRIS